MAEPLSYKLRLSKYSIGQTHFLSFYLRLFLLFPTELPLLFQELFPIKTKNSCLKHVRVIELPCIIKETC